MISRIAIGYLVMLGTMLTATYGSDNALVPLRQLYQQAQTALSVRDMQAFENLRPQLIAYPLYPYLLFADLKSRLRSATDEEILVFIETYRHTPLASRLRKAWLNTLADENLQDKFLAAYEPSSDVKLFCYYLTARIQSGQTSGITDAIKNLWLIGHSQPATCDSPFHWFEKQGELTSKRLWVRIELAMNQGNIVLVKRLSHKLNARDQKWVRLWLRTYDHPERMLNEPGLRDDIPITRKIVAFGIKRFVAIQDEGAAKALWEKLKPKYRFSTATKNAIERYIALSAAYRQHPNAINWLQALPANATDQQVRVWLARAAMRNADWSVLLETIHSMSKTQRQKEMWQYWRARALEEIGKTEQAIILYTQLAKRRSYYGFLSADRMGTGYHLENKPILTDSQPPQSLLKIPGILRARELYILNQIPDARREWEHTIRDFTPHQLRRAAKLASEWGWHANAIRTTAKTGHYHDLSIRFPTPFQHEIQQVAKQFRLDTAWLYGVIRRESAFQLDAQSAAGAQGLMQLMPATAKNTSRRLGLVPPHPHDLLDKDQNVLLGSAYMRQLLDEFNGSQVLATAAYNAGPNKVVRWLPQCGRVPADLWVDTLPYFETRRYVRAVLVYTTIFDWKLNARATRITERMAPVAQPQSG
jgi:soluble lytic murein transglycosylase